MTIALSRNNNTITIQSEFLLFDWNVFCYPFDIHLLYSQNSLQRKPKGFSLGFLFLVQLVALFEWWMLLFVSLLDFVFASSENPCNISENRNAMKFPRIENANDTLFYAHFPVRALSCSVSARGSKRNAANSLRISFDWLPISMICSLRFFGAINLTCR